VRNLSSLYTPSIRCRASLFGALTRGVDVSAARKIGDARSQSELQVSDLLRARGRRVQLCLPG
jgi:hypothetical protein